MVSKTVVSSTRRNPFRRSSAKRQVESWGEYQGTHSNLQLDTGLDKSKAHLAILHLGVAIWNCWRAQEPLTTPVLVGADLSGLDLENINFCQTNLSGADLSGSYLYDADFQGACLRNANLSRAGLIGANFHKADLSYADLSRAYLSQSDLSNANLLSACLEEADLESALLTSASFKQANLLKAALTDCFDITFAQLKAAQNAHLACCPAAMQAQLATIKKVSNMSESDMPNVSSARQVDNRRSLIAKLKAIGTGYWYGPSGSKCPNLI